MNIALAGKKGVGKDTAADFIMYEFQNMNKIALSRPIKYIISEVFNINEPELDDLNFKEQKRALFFGLIKSFKTISLINKLNKETYKKSLSSKLKYKIFKKLIFNSFSSYRSLMQYIGTDICRKYLNKDIFIDNLLIKTELFNKIGHYVLVSDVRFKNELDKLIASGFFTMLIKRFVNNPTIKDYHESENSLPSEDEFDFIIYNDGLLENYFNSIYNVLEIIKDVDGKWSI